MSLVYNWDARTIEDYIQNLVVLCRELKNGLQIRYNDSVPAEFTSLYEAFDLQEIVCGLSSFKYIHGKVVIDVENQFRGRKGMEFLQHVCALPQIRDHIKKMLPQIVSLTIVSSLPIT